jgi:uncharacterized protein YkwD
MPHAAFIKSVLVGALAVAAMFATSLTAAAAPSSHAHARAHRHHLRSARHRRHHRRHRGPHITAPQTLARHTVTPPQLPSGPCPNADLEPTSDNIAAIDAATLCLVNKQRAANGLIPLAENSKLDAAAANHNNDMIAGDYFDHVSPSGSTPLERIRAVGYIVAGAGYEIGENIATGSSGIDTPEAIVNDWMNSPGHRANILNAAYTETGIAVAPAMPASVGGGLSGATYTQDFGVLS